jgi:hypothetical protein
VATVAVPGLEPNPALVSMQAHGDQIMKYSKPELVVTGMAIDAISGAKDLVGVLESDPTSPYLSNAAYEIDD